MDTTVLKRNQALEFHTQSTASPIGKEIWLIPIFGSLTTSVGSTLLSPFLPIYAQQLGVMSKGTIVERTGAGLWRNLPRNRPNRTARGSSRGPAWQKNSSVCSSMVENTVPLQEA